MTRRKGRFLFVSFLMLAVLSAFTLTAYAEDGETAVKTEEIGFSLMENWADGGDAQELKVCDLYFSRDVLMKDDGSSIGYWFLDGADFTYLQKYFAINGRTMEEINKNTDTSDYVFSTFPSTEGGVYAVPVAVYSAEPNHMQIRIHEKYVEDNLKGKEITVSVLEGFYATARTTNEDASGYETVRYELSKTVTFTKDAQDKWTCGAELVPYEAPEEVIDRADIDFSAIEYKPLYVSGVSEIVVYDQASQAEYMVLYFDKAVSNQYIPYASAGKQTLTNLAKAGLGVTLTQAQIDSLYDYRLDISLNDFIRIDGKTVREMKKEEKINPDQKLYLCWSGSSSDPRSVTFYFAGDGESWLDPAQRHTLEVLEGFTTPLFGKVTKTQTYYFDPETRAWSETDYASLDAPVYDWSLQEAEVTASCSSVIGVSGAAFAGALLAGAAAGAVLLRKRKGGDRA